MNEREVTDLVCLAHRDALGEEELRELERGLAASFEVRLASTILGELDRESQVLRGDEALVKRIADRAASSLAGTNTRFVPRARALLVAITVLLVAAVATGAYYVTVKTAPDHARLLAVSASEGAVRAPSGAGSRGHRVLHPAILVESLPEPWTPHEPGAVPSASGGSTHVGAVASVASLPTPGSGELFAEANRLRRDGERVAASRLYQTILSRHPGAKEAPLARLALAKLKETDDPQAALREYQTLAQSGGSLQAEALWGLAETARRMGNGEVERQALRRIATEFPTSPYAKVARERSKHAAP